MTCLHRERQFLVNGDYYREQIKLPRVYGLEIMGKGEKVMVLVCVWQHGGQGDRGRKEQVKDQEEATGTGMLGREGNNYTGSASLGSGGLQLVLGCQDPGASHLWL